MLTSTFSNRPVQTRMPGGVGGVRPMMAGPYPDLPAFSFWIAGSLNRVSRRS